MFSVPQEIFSNEIEEAGWLCGIGKGRWGPLRPNRETGEAWTHTQWPQFGLSLNKLLAKAPVLSAGKRPPFFSSSSPFPSHLHSHFPSPSSLYFFSYPLFPHQLPSLLSPQPFLFPIPITLPEVQPCFYPSLHLHPFLPCCIPPTPPPVQCSAITIVITVINSLIR